MSNQQEEFQSDTDIEFDVKEPSLFSVFLINDDFTTQDFVIQVLTEFFHKSESEAFEIMLKVHKTGKGLAGVFTKEIAETKVYFVKQAAKENNFPLRCSMEPCE